MKRPDLETIEEGVLEGKGESPELPYVHWKAHFLAILSYARHLEEENKRLQPHSDDMNDVVLAGIEVERQTAKAKSAYEDGYRKGYADGYETSE